MNSAKVIDRAADRGKKDGERAFANLGPGVGPGARAPALGPALPFVIETKNCWPSRQTSMNTGLPSGTAWSARWICPRLVTGWRLTSRMTSFCCTLAWAAGLPRSTSATIAPPRPRGSSS
jgi:hypothetical protein